MAGVILVNLSRDRFVSMTTTLSIRAILCKMIKNILVWHLKSDFIFTEKTYGSRRELCASLFGGEKIRSNCVAWLPFDITHTVFGKKVSGTLSIRA